MKFTPKVKKFQTGGEIAPEEMPEEQVVTEEAPAQELNPLIVIAEAAMQALQSQDCNMAMQVCQAMVQLVQQAAGPAPEAAQGEPVFRKGGKLLRYIKR